jgi:hypothetical protein
MVWSLLHEKGGGRGCRGGAEAAKRGRNLSRLHLPRLAPLNDCSFSRQKQKRTSGREIDLSSILWQSRYLFPAPRGRPAGPTTEEGSTDCDVIAHPVSRGSASNRNGLRA